MCACGCEAALCCCESNIWLTKRIIQIKIFPTDGQTSVATWSTQANSDREFAVGLLLKTWPGGILQPLQPISSDSSFSIVQHRPADRLVLVDTKG